jgi:hypothetical protein
MDPWGEGLEAKNKAAYQQAIEMTQAAPNGS